MTLFLAKNLKSSIALVEEAVLALHLLDTVLIQMRQLFGRFDIIHLLNVAFCEDQVNLLERASRRLRVVEVDEWQKARVDKGEEEV
ncbi:hypothetical protein M3J09_008268 [Ascochyta lentis]